jgi:hypothetical protein
MKKSSDIRGDLHRGEILKFIKNKSSKDWRGVEINEIVNHTGLSRQTVTEHVSKLVANNELKKTRRGTYLSAEIFDDIAYNGWGIFESSLNMASQYIIEDGNILNLQNLGNIAQTLTNNSNQTMEKFIFKFANRLGAFLVYVFIESLRSRRNVSTEDVRSVLTAEFLAKVVPMMDFLEVFLYQLPIDPKERTYFEVNESTLQKVSAAYSNVYPNLAESLEAGYLEFCNNLLPKPNNNCAHTWEKIYLHKVGDLFLCRKCNGIDRSPEHRNN